MIPDPVDAVREAGATPRNSTGARSGTGGLDAQAAAPSAAETIMKLRSPTGMPSPCPANRRRVRPQIG
jgi:hypothetical protein